MAGTPRWPKRAVAAGCATALAVSAAACSTRHQDAAGADGIRAMLGRRAAAVLHHDEAAFLATVDPRSAALRAAQRRVFGNLAAVPLASFGYRLRATGGFPAPSGETAAEVELDYALRDYDAAPVSGTGYLTLVRRDGRWYVAGTTGPAGHPGAVQPWDQGKVTVVRGRHSLVLGSGTPDALRRYASLADAAVPVVRAAWPGPWPGKAVVEVPADEAGMAALLGAAPSAYQGIAAVTTAELRGSATAPADRVIVNPQAFAGLSALGRTVVLTHEITHVATRKATTAGTPLWLSEGFADWVGYTGTGRPPRQAAPELAADVVAGHPPRALPATADFGTTSGGLAQAYEGAWLACRMIAGTWGSGRLTALYQAAGRMDTDTALRRTLGLGLDAFTARWRAYLTEELR